MKVAVFETVPNGLKDVITSLWNQSASVMHSLVDDPGQADLIVFAGDFACNPDRVLEHAAFVSYPHKSTVYTEDDHYLPLLPGVYTSPHKGVSTEAGRVRSFAYLSAYGSLKNTSIKRVGGCKDLLFSFQGSSTSIVRKRLYNIEFAEPDVLIQNSSSYRHWEPSQQGREAMQQEYANNIARSHFVLCPRGAGTGSIRLFEVMQMGVAPILLSDSYPLPHGPSWSEFLLRVCEKDIAQLPDFAKRHLENSEIFGSLAASNWLKWFGAGEVFNHLVEECYTALNQHEIDEVSFRRRWPLLIGLFNARRRGRMLARSTALNVMNALGRKLPYQIR